MNIINYSASMSDDGDAAARLSSQHMIEAITASLRAPLYGVTGLAELLNDGVFEGPQLRMLEGIVTSGMRLERICHDLQQLADLQSGDLMSDRQKVAPIEVVRTAVGTVYAEASLSGIDVRIEQLGDLPSHVLVDAQRINEILSILLHNALSFTSEGWITVAVGAEDAALGKIIKVTVRDTGCGIPFEYADVAFVPFELRRLCHNEHHEGLGIGLARALHLARLIGGEIYFDSTMGEGTTFTVEIPFQLPESVEERATVRAGQSSVRRVLVIEDNEVNRLLAVRQLRKLGYESTAVSDGHIGVSEALTGGYDAILMDCRMPGLDGMAATHMIRLAEKELHRHTPIIALTANASAEDRDACLTSGMDDYLAKPVDLATLSSTLRRWVVTSDDVSLPVLDSRSLAKLASELDDDGAIDEVLAHFASQLPARRLRILAAVRSGKRDDITDSASALRAASLGVGALTLARACASIEWSAEAGVVTEQMLEELTTAAVEVDEALAERRHRTG